MGWVVGFSGLFGVRAAASGSGVPNVCGCLSFCLVGVASPKWATLAGWLLGDMAGGRMAPVTLAGCRVVLADLIAVAGVRVMTGAVVGGILADGLVVVGRQGVALAGGSVCG